jgi:hypothetical protein
MLSSGKVLVAGGTAVVAIASTEIYDPATNAWSAAPSLAAARYGHAATLLASGKVLVSGGANSALLTSSELFDVGVGFAESSRPTISSVIGSFAQAFPLQLVGSGFTGNSEASSGNTISSSTNFPLVHLRRLDNQQQAWLQPAASNSRSSTTYTSRALSGFAAGPYALTVFVNGIPSVAQIVINVSPQSLIFVAQAPAFQALVIGGTFQVSPLAVAGASSSPVTYSVSPSSVCSISGTTITMNGLGSCAITANQAGDANYVAADPVTRSVDVVATLDVDRSVSASQYHAHTDGLLILRYLDGVTGAALVANVIGNTAARGNAVAVASYLDAIRPKLDIDGNGVPDASTDGVLIVRYLLGFRGAALVENALATSPPATRTLPVEIETYLQGLMP